MKLISYTLISALLSFWFGEPEVTSQKAVNSAPETEICPEEQQSYSIERALAPLIAYQEEMEALKKTPLPMRIMAPSITATKVFALVGTDNGPTGPSPTDVLEYTVVITNAAGAMDATGTKFTDTVDPNTTLVAGSLKTSVVAINDTYSTVGNVSISVPAASGLTSNDVNLDGDVLMVTGVNTAGTMGTVTFAADGSFTFNPAPGFTGSTTFTYTVSDGMFNSIGTVTVTMTGMIWFIQTGATAPGDGRLGSPFSSIANFNSIAVDEDNDNIFLYTGAYSGSLVLLNGQNLIGQGAVGTLASLAGVTFSAFPPISPAMVPSVGGTNPTIANAVTTLTTAMNNDVLGVTINNSGGTAVTGNNLGTLKVRNVTLSNTSGIALNLTNGTLDAIFQSISASNASHGIRIQNTTGSFEITGSSTTDGTGGTFSNISQRGIELLTVTNVTLRNLTMMSANTADAGFDTVCDEDDNIACYAAIHMNAVTGTNLFNNVDITTTAEHGINGNTVTNLTLTNCTVTGAGNAVEENAVKFINLTGTCSFTGCTFTESGCRNTHIRTGTGSLNLTVNNCSFSNTTYDINNTNRFDCFEMRTLGAATATVNITNSTFHRAGSKGIQCIAEGSSTFNFNISNSSIQRFGNPMAGIEVGSVGTATINYNITNNTAIEAGNEVAVLGSTFNTSILNGRVNNNASIESGHPSATIFANTRMLHEMNSVARLEIKDNNSITSINAQEGVLGISRIGTNGTSRLDFIVNNNNVTNGAAIPEGIETRTGQSTMPAETNTNCSFIANNDVVTAGTTRVFRARIINGSGSLNLQGGVGSGVGVPGNWTANGNTPAPTPGPMPPANVVSFAQAPAVITFTGTCNTPPHAFAPTEEELLAALAANETAPVVEAAPEAVVQEAPTVTDEPVVETPSALTMFSGETITVGGVPGFPLPAGQTMTIVFRVTIDNPFPLGDCYVSNQGTVTGTNFSNVLTDDPAFGGAADPTVTSLSIAPTITVCQGNISTGTDPGLCTASESFSATAVGCTAPTLTFRIGATVITSPHVFPIGTTTVDVTASNGVMPNATCSFTVTVTDTQAPDITCLVGTQTRGTNLGNCTYTVSGSEFNPTVNENCPGFTLTNSFNNTNTLAGAALPTGTTVVTWTITDGATPTPLTDMCTVTIQVTDDDAPTINCPTNILVDCPADVPAPYASLTAFTTAGGTVGDNCGINDASFALINSAGTPQMFTRTYQITDINGLTATCAQTVTVSDGTPPVITPGTIDACYPTVGEAETAAIAATMVMDNCPGAVTVTASTMSMADCAVTITVTAKDAANNMDMTTYTTRIDGMAPIVMQGMIEACYETLAEAETAALAATSATDNCSGPLTETILTVGTCEAVITVTTTDGCGNSTPVTYMTSIDNQDPTVTTGTIAACYPTEAAAETAAIAATTAMDDCPSTIIKTASTAGDCSAVVTVTATDACGNSVSTMYNTRIDGEMPTATQGMILSCYPTAMAAEAAAKLVTTWGDNCSSSAYLETHESASTVGDCSAVITVKTMDECGNMGTATYMTRIDNTPPNVTQGTIEACYPTAAAAETAALEATSATDNCSGTLTETAIVTNEADCAAVVTVTTTDGCGNFDVVTYNTRIDNTPPTVTKGTILTCYPTEAEAEAAAIAATTTSDNCTGTVTKTAFTTGDCTAMIMVTATDGCGNSTSVTYDTRIDNTPPNVTTGTIAACYATVAEAEAAALLATSATDNCPGVLTETVLTEGTCTATVTVTTTDGCGKSATAIYTTRIDNAGPTVTPGTIAACYPTEAEAEAAAIDATTAMDDCPSSVIKTASTMGDCEAVITVTATDGCGNSASTTYNTRIDNTAPTFTIGSIEPCYQTAALAEAAAIAATTASDNCMGTVTKTASTSGDCLATVTVTATDGCGNSASISYSTRIDGTAPNVTQGTIASCYSNAAAAEAAALAATSATDNCSGPLFESVSTAGTCSAEVSVITTDGCGNSTTVTYNTRIDNTPPTVTPGTIAPCYTTVAAAQAAAIAATTATDNCGGTVTKTASTAGLCSAIVTVTATDFCGNSATTTYTTNIDNTPPTVVCKNSTVFVNSQGAYTLLPSDVFNAGASSDNCPGSLTVVSITPATVTCAQKNTTIPVTVVVADACNNQSTCISMITVDEDNALPPGWDNSDVSTANGSAIFSPCTGENGSFVLTATGFSMPSSDKLHIAYKEICGNTTVTARVTSISGGGWGGVMIRETLMPGAKKVALKTQLTSNIRREFRATTNGTTTSLNYFRPGHAWLRLERTGSNFVAYSSPNGVNWSFAFSTTISMSGCVYVGIFSESVNNATTNTATFDNVSVTGTPNTLAHGPSGHINSESGDLVRIYPNPTTGEVSINLDVHAGKPGTIQVFNALGALVTQERLIPGNLETHDMQIVGAAGVYTVVIQLDDRRIVRRVVVDPNGGK